MRALSENRRHQLCKCIRAVAHLVLGVGVHFVSECLPESVAARTSDHSRSHLSPRAAARVRAVLVWDSAFASRCASLGVRPGDREGAGEKSLAPKRPCRARFSRSSKILPMASIQSRPACPKKWSGLRISSPIRRCNFSRCSPPSAWRRRPLHAVVWRGREGPKGCTPRLPSEAHSLRRSCPYSSGSGRSRSFAEHPCVIP